MRRTHKERNEQTRQALLEAGSSLLREVGLGLPEGAGEHLAARAVLLDGTYREVATAVRSSTSAPRLPFGDAGQQEATHSASPSVNR